MRYIRITELVLVTGLSRSTIYRLELAGKFPNRHQITARTVGWSDIEVNEWLAAREPGRHRSVNEITEEQRAVTRIMEDEGVSRDKAQRLYAKRNSGKQATAGRPHRSASPA